MNWTSTTFTFLPDTCVLSRLTSLDSLKIEFQLVAGSLIIFQMERDISESVLHLKILEMWMESNIHENRKTCKLGDFESETNTRCKSVRCLRFQNANTSHSKNIFGQLRWQECGKCAWGIYTKRRIFYGQMATGKRVATKLVSDEKANLKLKEAKLWYYTLSTICFSFYLCPNVSDENWKCDGYSTDSG